MSIVERLRLLAQSSQPEWQRISENAFQKAHAYSWDDATDLLEAVLSATTAAAST